MRSRSVIVIHIRTKDTTQRRFVEHEHMVQALAPDRTNHALDVGPLPGGSRGAQHFLDTHVSHLSPEGIAEDSIAVAQQVARELICSCWACTGIPCSLAGCGIIRPMIFRSS